MAFLTGVLLIDAPASALNNAGQDSGARAENKLIVKSIQTPYGVFPYVSAQAYRYWLRTYLEQEKTDGWRAAPVFRTQKIAYTDADPLEYWDDDLFGYMRAPSKKSGGDTGAEGASPLEENREITRISPLRVSTFVGVFSGGLTEDFGTMARHEGDPVPFEHEFYTNHLLGMLSLDLTAAGTFYDGERVGYKNLDKFRREKADKMGLEKTTVRGFTAYRLPLAERKKRVAALIKAMGKLHGGAKQALHYTNVLPSVCFLTVLNNGNNPFFRVIGRNQRNRTEFRPDAMTEVMDVFADDLLAPVLVGWEKGFLDEERQRFEEWLQASPHRERIKLDHPARQFERLAEMVLSSESDGWFS